jgi:hypothetical protein
VSVQGALNHIAKSPEGAQAIVNANVFDVFPELFNSRAADVRKWTAEILGTLAEHDFGLKLVLTSNLCTKLVSLLRWVRFPLHELDVDYPAAMARTMSP